MCGLNVPEKYIRTCNKREWISEELKKYGLYGFFGALMVTQFIFPNGKYAYYIFIHCFF